MKEKFCERFFYAEVPYPKCDHMSPASGRCTRDWMCPYMMHLGKEEHAILDNLRIVKEQNLKILEQNKNIIEELALQQLQKLK